jgi:hypothetical protein
MRLFELDSGGARAALSLYQGQADKENRAKELSFAELLNILKPFDLPLGGLHSGDKDKILVALKNAIDPNGDVFDVKGDGNGTVVLNTKVKSADQQQPTTASRGPSVDAMANSGAKKLQPDI